MPRVMPGVIAALVLLPFSAPADATSAQGGPPGPEAIGALSIEELMTIRVITATRHAQAMEDIPAAVAVLTSEDIRRSGARTLMDALRLVPGVYVARVDATRWSISVRGFGHRFANKLLVLLDGRSIYSPLLNGVFWELHDIAPDDIDRIEVVRGPGGSMWGANAVNGVINIITKRAADTQGLRVAAYAGDQESGSGDVRVGGSLGGADHFRVSTRYRTQGAFRNATNTDTNRDGARFLRTDLRADWERGGNRYTLSAHVLDGSTEQAQNAVALTPPYSQFLVGRHPHRTWHLLGRWEASSAGGGETAIQAYVHHGLAGSTYAREDRNTVDLQVQHRLRPAGPHTLLVGANLRNSSYSMPMLQNGRPVISPTAATNHTYGLFLHSEHALRPDVRLSVGARFDRNDFTGWEVQPNARLLWRQGAETTWWASIARAVRTPTQSDRGAYISAQLVGLQQGLPVVATILGDPNAPSETVVSHEIGFRRQFSRTLSADVTAFFCTYDRVRAMPPGTPFFEPAPHPHFVLPTGFAYTQGGETWGAEVSAQFRPSDRLHLRAGYTFFDARMRLAKPAGESMAFPHHMGYVSAAWDLGSKWQLDGSLSVTDRPIIEGWPIAAHARLDLRLAWRPSADLELSAVGQNLLTARRLEYSVFDFVSGALTERAFYLQITWRR
ncbi:MAG TPA: TonB-dependent receptor [Chthonomonadales bacterium]|nr:TonB-dependent receptor [Chthonomonadales bacterium]